MDFKLHSKYQPCGDQPQAIEALTQGIKDGLSTQVLRGVTDSCGFSCLFVAVSDI